MTALFGFEVYAPKEIAERVENVGVAKARLPLVSTAALGVLAGGFIGLGCVYFGVVAADASLSFAAKRVLGGLVFSTRRRVFSGAIRSGAAPIVDRRLREEKG